MVQNSIPTKIPCGNNRQLCDRTYFLMLPTFHRALSEVLALGLQRTCSPRVNTPCAGPAKRISYAGWPILDGSYTSVGTFPCKLIFSCSTIPSLVPWQPSRWPEMLINKLSHYRTPKHATILSSECTVFQGRLPYSRACMVVCPPSRGPGTPTALLVLKREWHPKCSTSCDVYARLEAC